MSVFQLLQVVLYFCYSKFFGMRKFSVHHVILAHLQTDSTMSSSLTHWGPYILTFNTRCSKSNLFSLNFRSSRFRHWSKNLIFQISGWDCSWTTFEIDLFIYTTLSEPISVNFFSLLRLYRLWDSVHIGPQQDLYDHQDISWQCEKGNRHMIEFCFSITNAVSVHVDTFHVSSYYIFM